MNILRGLVQCFVPIMFVVGCARGIETLDGGLTDAGLDARGDGITADRGTFDVPDGGCAPGDRRGCYSGAAASRTVGRCHDGTQMCGANGTWASGCVGEVLPSAMEICANMVDDNCNGMTDESCACTSTQTQACYTGPTLTRSIGACRDGSRSCMSGAWSTTCAGEVKPMPTDVCGNSVDDDCNGMTDDGCGECNPGDTRACYTGNPPATRMVGACRDGTQVCGTTRTWGTTCIGEVKPATMETCGNSIDDNCTGAVDEGCMVADPCASQTSCTGCAGQAACGWCSNLSGCYTGSSSGPSSGACSGTNWNYLSSSCPNPSDPCSRNTSCDSCTTSSGCGWCGSNNRCSSGSLLGPNSGSCGSWSYYFFMC